MVRQGGQEAGPDASGHLPGLLGQEIPNGSDRVRVAVPTKDRVSCTKRR